MPRNPRFYAPGVAYYVAQSVPDKTPCFYKDSDYRQCLKFLQDAAFDYDCQINAYALIPNGLHLIVVPSEEQSIPRFMQSLARRYVTYINHENHRAGSLWTQRYKASAVDELNFLVPVSLYIELLPVQLGYAELPKHYYWSSYQYKALGIRDSLTSLPRTYIRLGNDATSRQRRYQQLAATPLETAMRLKIKRCLELGLPIGSRQFKLKLARRLNVLPEMLDQKRKSNREERQNQNQYYPRSV